MDDRLLHEIRSAPDPRFARGLRERLRRQEEPRPAPPRRMAPLLAAAAAVTLVVTLFAVPSVRVSAESVLDLFRVRRFAAVEYSASRMETLRSLEKETALLVFDREEKLRDPGPRRHVPSLEAAGSAAGFRVSAPGYLPDGLAPDSVFIQDEGSMRLTVSESRLRTLLDRLELRDVAVPAGIDGRWIEVRQPPIVIQQFRGGGRRAFLLEARSPEVSVPAGMDVERLAEVGLRVLGLDAGEARRIARATDWRSTLVVPVPMNASTFRQVTVRGQSGLLITTASATGADGHRHREGTAVLWTEGDRVFGLQSNLGAPDVMQMAESVP
jgi:hypothetical protein